MIIILIGIIYSLCLKAKVLSFIIIIIIIIIIIMMIIMSACHNSFEVALLAKGMFLVNEA